MNKIFLIASIVVMNGFQCHFYAMEKPVEATSQVKNIKEVPQDIQAKANWVKDQSFSASASAKVSDTVAENNKKLQDLHGIDAQVTPESTGSMFDPATTFQLQDGSSLDVQFASLTGRPTRSTFKQYNKISSSTPITKVDTQYNIDGSMKENIYKNVKNRSVQSQMVEYNKDGSFTITNYGKDGKTIQDKTTFDAKAKSAIEDEPLTDEQKAGIKKLQPQADAYASNPTEQTKSLLVQEIVKAVIPDTATSQERDSLTQDVETALNKVDTTQQNWFLNFFKMISDFISRLFGPKVTASGPISVNFNNSVDLSGQQQEQNLFAPEQQVENAQGQQKKVELAQENKTMESLSAKSGQSIPQEQFKEPIDIPGTATETLFFDSAETQDGRQESGVVSSVADQGVASQESQSTIESSVSKNKKKGKIHYMQKRFKEVQSGQAPKIFKFQKNNQPAQ